jgi:3-hydroxyisobutyrate dehydrogenase-like beta-hydroxyacid dehydrogenase
MPPIQKIGFIGVGNMGTPMAAHLVKAGFDVTVHDVRPETVSMFIERHGGKTAASLGELARGVDAGHALKALANYVNACALINSIEALTIGRKFGLDAKFIAEALVPLCAGRNHPIEKKVLPHVLTRKYGTGMALGFIAKDVKIARDTARSMGAFAPLAEKVSELWSAAAEKLGPQIDQTEIVRYWEEATGVRLTP